MDFGKNITLVPFSGIQFIDFEFPASDLSAIRRRFYEQPASAETNYQPVLHPIVMEDGVLRDPHTQTALTNDNTISVSGGKGITSFLGQWIPIPLMRVISAAEDGKAAQLDEGPTNWARIYISPIKPDKDGNAELYRVVLAIDTSIETIGRDDGDPYLAPTSVDVALRSTFCFSDNVDDIAWFVCEPWVDAWVSDSFGSSTGRGRGAAAADDHAGAEAANEGLDSRDGLSHLAHYLTMLSVLNELCDLPQICFLDIADRSKNEAPISVDLVLDFGKASTFGVLMEHQEGDGPQDLQRTSVLALRDLSSPAQIYAHAFDSRVEFAPPAFGKQALSRQSGRSNAFFWPSFARIGDEARRLSDCTDLSDTQSGFSDLKSNLLDCQAQADGWCFTNAAEAGVPPRRQQVYGPLLRFLNESGDVFKAGENAGGQAAVRAKFSRSALTSIFFCEVVQQAIVQINSPYSRAHQPKVNAARRLGRIVIAKPAGLSPEESKLLLKRVDAGVELVWQAMGWADQGPITAPPRPSVELGIDEPLGAQTAYLYDQVVRKFPGPVQDYLSLKGKSRGESGAQSVLRIAAIDIGARTMGLSIATYSAVRDDTVRRKLALRANVQIGGDNIVQAIAAQHIAPAVAARLSQMGTGNGAEILDEALSNGKDGKNAARILEEFGLALLRDYEDRAEIGPDRKIQTTFGLLLAAHGNSVPYDGITNFDQMFSAKTNEPFSLLDCDISLHQSQLSATINDVLSPPMSDLSAIVHALDCDICLLSGRVSHLREACDVLAEAAPVSAHRTVALRDYQPGNWYPVSDGAAHNNAAHNGAAYNNAAHNGDAKTAAAMGALVDLLADGRLHGFAVQDDTCEPAEAAGEGLDLARHVIVIDADGKIIPATDESGEHVIVLECDASLLPDGFANAASTAVSQQSAKSDKISGGQPGTISAAEHTSPAGAADIETLQSGDHKADASPLHMSQSGAKGRIEVEPRDRATNDSSLKRAEDWDDHKAVKSN